jgi:methyltransferase family protein
MSTNSSRNAFGHDDQGRPVPKAGARPLRFQPVPPQGSLLSDVDLTLALIAGDGMRDEIAALATLAHVTATLSGHIVTVGTNQRTAAALGSAARAAGPSRVFAIDVFPDGDESPDDGPLSLDDFLGAMARTALLEYVLPHHGTAATFAQLMPADFRARLIVLDGAHACTNVETDMFLLEQFLVDGGWLCVTESFSSFPRASDALETLFRQRNHFDLNRQLTPALFVARKRAL